MNPKASPHPELERSPYETPAVIYEGEISTRAITGAVEGADPSGVDPADIFGDGQ